MSSLSPNMNLIVPTVSVEPGPTWAQDLNSSLSILDQHTHAPGSGIQITQAGISLSSSSAPFNSLNFNSTNAYGLRSVKFNAQLAALALATDLGCLYEAGVDLYYNDGSGNQIRLTQGGSIVGSSGSISGLPSGTASASFSSGTFVWQSATNTAANMDAGSYIFRNATASSKSLTLSPPNAMAADYSLVLPAVPGATNLMQLDTSGNMSASVSASSPSFSGSITAGTAIASGTTITAGSALIATTSVTAGTTFRISGGPTLSAVNAGATLSSDSDIQLGTLKAILASPNDKLVTIKESDASNAKGVVMSPVPGTTGLKLIRGLVGSSGSINSGEGFSVSHPGTGQYNITITTALLENPAVIVTPEIGSPLVAISASITTSTFTIGIYNLSGVATDSAFSFIAIGQTNN